MKSLIILIALVLLTGLSSAYVLPNTYVNGTLNVNHTTVLNATRVTSLVASGSSYLNTTTISTGDTLAVTDADGLTIGGKIIPQKMIVTVPLTNMTRNGTIFIADDAWTVSKIEEVHTAPATGFSNCTLYVMKVTGTSAPTAGTYMTNVSIDLKGTAETIQTARLSGKSGNCTLADGNRIGIYVNNRLNDKITALSGGCLTVTLTRA
jgi:hypothetical protein